MVSDHSEKNSLTRKKSFSYLEKLHLQKDFKLVFQRGLRLENKHIKILVLNRNDENRVRRFGLVTSKKVGIAVVRNKTKRRLREFFRTNKHNLVESLDLLFVLKKETARLKFEDLQNSIVCLLESAKLYFKREQ
jgi:ribonuclease P protein component